MDGNLNEIEFILIPLFVFLNTFKQISRSAISVAFNVYCLYFCIVKCLNRSRGKKWRAIGSIDAAFVSRPSTVSVTLLDLMIC